MELTAKLIREAVDGIDAVTDMKVRSYSGRGMSGRECVAVALERPGHLIKLGMSIAYLVASRQDDARDAADEIDATISEMGTPHMDTLGMGLVAYWPSIPYED